MERLARKFVMSSIDGKNKMIEVFRHKSSYDFDGMGLLILKNHMMELGFSLKKLKGIRQRFVLRKTK